MYKKIPPVITIDGPTASGKGTVARRVADCLSWKYLDSGSLYRLTALMSFRFGVSYTDEVAIANLAETLPVVYSGNSIFLDKDDVSLAIREESVGEIASQIAVLPLVRKALLLKQRSFRQYPGLVTDGRDMGSVVFPDAALKVFLTADPVVRVQRRCQQLVEQGVDSSQLEACSSLLQQRDLRDASRKIAPLKEALDAFVIDTSNLSIEEVVAEVVSVYQKGTQIF